MKKFIIIVLLTILVITIKVSAYETPLDYMKGNNLTESQANYVLEKSKETKDPDHFIKWFTAIQAHEQGKTFVNWETKFIAGRLKPWMEYKDFKTQMDGWTTAYNKFWYKNNTASDWIVKSKYCVSDTHWGGAGCPNWIVNVPTIVNQYPSKIESSEKSGQLKIQNIDAGDEKPTVRKNLKVQKPIQIKKICRQIGKVWKDEYIQLDTSTGKFRRWVKDLFQNDKVFLCKDL